MDPKVVLLALVWILSTVVLVLGAFVVRLNTKLKWQVQVIEDIAQAYHQAQADTEWYKKGLEECEAYLLEDAFQR